MVKHLHRVGVEQSKQVETLASFSILPFHDSTEMFLKLLAVSDNPRTNIIEAKTMLINMSIKVKDRISITPFIYFLQTYKLFQLKKPDSYNKNCQVFI